MTLIETLVSCLVLVLIGGAFLQSVVQARTLWAVTRAESQEVAGLYAANWALSRELQLSQRDAITLLPAPPAIAFAVATGPDGVFHTDKNGMPDWQGFVVYWQFDHTLYRKVLTRSANAPLKEAELRQEIASPSGATLVEKDVTSFHVQFEGDACVRSDLGVSTRDDTGQAVQLQSTARTVLWH